MTASSAASVTLTAAMALSVMIAASAAVTSPLCTGDGSCAESLSPRAGSAMLQKESTPVKPRVSLLVEHAASKDAGRRTKDAGRRTKDAARREKVKEQALQSSVGNMETDMAALRTKVAALETEVGVRAPTVTEATALAERVLREERVQQLPASPAAATASLAGGGPSIVPVAQALQYQSQYQAGAPMALIDNTPLFGNQALLGSQHFQEPIAASGTLKGRVTKLEEQLSDMRSRVMSLENEIKGAHPASLLEIKQESVNSGLKSRAMAIDDMIDKLKTKVASLEHMVLGN